MMWQVMGYAMGVAAALSLVGYCQERLAVMRNLPRRWVWPLTMVLSVAWAAGFMLRAEPTPPQLDIVVTPASQLDVEVIGASGAPAITATAPGNVRWNPPADGTLLTAWAGASLLMLLFLLVAGVLLRRRSARWRRASVLGRELLVSDSVGPALMGTWQPRIVVPEWFLAEAPARQELILRHEEQHIAARDPMLLRAATLFAVALPWNLPLWWQLRRMRQGIEMDCDARVLHQGVSPVEYGSVLLAVTRRCAVVPAGLIAMSEPTSALERRVRNVLRGSATPSMGRVAAVMAFWMAGIGAAVGLEAPHLAQREASRPDQREERAVPQALPMPEVPRAPVARPADSALPRLLPPDIGPNTGPTRREVLEQAIVERHPELVNGAEREGQAFVSVLLRHDGSVENTVLRYVEAGDAAGLEAAMRNALEPLQGQLLLARGWQIAGSATVKSQTRVSYRTIRDPGAVRREQQAWEARYAAVKQLVEHHLPGAMTNPGTRDRGTPYLIVSNDGRVLKSGYNAMGANPGTLQGEVPGQRLTRYSIMPRFLGQDSPQQLVVAWVEP